MPVTARFNASMLRAGVPDGKWGETGRAYIIKKQGTDISGDELGAFLENKLARYKWPTQYAFCEDFPRTSLGKVRKALLVKQEDAD